MPPAPGELLAAMPYAVRLGVRLETATADEVVGALPWSEDLCTVGGVLHGGALMSLADAVGAACAFLNLPAGAGTVESRTNFLRGVRAGEVRANGGAGARGPYPRRRPDPAARRAGPPSGTDHADPARPARGRRLTRGFSVSSAPGGAPGPGHGMRRARRCGPLAAG